MKNCQIELCQRIPGCLLEQYFINRRTNNLAAKAELAISFEKLGDLCPIVGDLAKKYPQRLSASRRALRQLHDQQSP